MKTVILIVSLVVLQYVNAQVVNIPGPAFKSALLDYIPAIDTNADSEIQVSEALAVNTLNISQMSITDLSGIEAFSNLQNLYCSQNYGLNALDLLA